MANEIKIKVKPALRGDDGYKVISVRMKEELVTKLDELSVQTNRSRNQLINLLLESAIDMVKIEECPVQAGAEAGFGFFSLQPFRYPLEKVLDFRKFFLCKRKFPCISQSFSIYF